MQVLVKARKAYEALLAEVLAKAQQAPQDGHGPVVDPPGLAILVCYVAFEYLSHALLGGFNSGMDAAADAFLRQVVVRTLLGAL